MVLNYLNKLKAGLNKTRERLVRKIDQALGRYRRIDEALLEEIEEILIQGDMGVATTLKILDQVRERVQAEGRHDPAALYGLLQEEISRILNHRQNRPVALEAAYPPHVILVVGVNGTGKTTTIGKLAWRYRQEGKTVLLAAADTFRAAAAEQLEIWAQRAGVDLVRHQSGSDPASVAFDALQAAQARGIDILIIDTAGRLHTKSNLMEELKKIKRVLVKQRSDIPHEVLLVLDSTTGQNALTQAKLFDEAVGVTGIVLTKLDGTAKGGMVVAINDQLAIPVKMIGLGEQLADLHPFDPRAFVEALFKR